MFAHLKFCLLVHEELKELYIPIISDVAVAKGLTILRSRSHLPELPESP